MNNTRRVSEVEIRAIRRKNAKRAIHELDQDQIECLLWLHQRQKLIDEVANNQWRRTFNVILFVPGVLLGWLIKIRSPIWDKQEEIYAETRRGTRIWAERLGYKEFDVARDAYHLWRSEMNRYQPDSWYRPKNTRVTTEQVEAEFYEQINRRRSFIERALVHVRARKAVGA